MSELTNQDTSTPIGLRIERSLCCLLVSAITRLQRLSCRCLSVVCLAGACSIPAQAAMSSVYLEELTWTDLKAKQSAGLDTVLIPIGGTEQNGPHMVLGKHNVRVKFLAGEIAKGLGNAVVAPVLAYVPEGSITPPAAHMRFTGTMSISGEAFEAVLDSTAKSFKQHGFHHVVFLGDHGGYQQHQERVAARLNKAWAKERGFQALAFTQYYELAQQPYNDLLRAKGFSKAEIGTHAGLADTSLAMAVDTALVHPDRFDQAAQMGKAQGVAGDPRRASVDLGKIGIALIVDNSVRAIQKALHQP